MRRFVIALTAVLASAFAASAQGTETPVPEMPPLAGSQWQLVSWEMEGVVTPVILEGEITLDFNSDSELTGSGGCNNYSGPYAVDGSTISLGPVVSTKMACADENRNRQESAYFAMLDAVTHYQHSGSRLTLTTEDGRTLHFAARGAYGLIGSEWVLTAYGTPGSGSDVVGDTPPTLAFTSDTEVTAFGGCNGWSSTYTADDENVDIEQGVGTLIGCADDINAQETAYFAMLADVTTFDLSGGELMLWTSDGRFLRFTPTGEYALMSTQWRMSQMVIEGDMAFLPVEGSIVTLAFNADGTAGGSAGCNQYGGRYAIGEDGALAFSEVVSTLMACANTELMDQEIRYLDLINTTERFDIVDGMLTLYAANNSQVSFVPADDQLAPDEA